MLNDHFILRIIAEDSDIYFITKALPFEEVRFLNQLSQLIQPLFDIAHGYVSSLHKAVKCRQCNIIAIATDSIL